jgi:hypothetical protein
MKYLYILIFVLNSSTSYGQHLKLKSASFQSPSGTEFAKSIRDNSLNLADRELLILGEIRSGNIPAFYRQLVEITDTATIAGKMHTIRYFVLPDFLAIGSDTDYFYCPMTPILAQKVANLLNCNLPTRKISDMIYRNAVVKMVPEPIPPSKEMITIPVFEKHNAMVHQQRLLSIGRFPLGSLVAGNKKDVVISNKIHTDKGALRVVIYGWHNPDGKAIQPLYNGHTPDWADYSHGIRLVQNKVWINGKRYSMQKVLKSPELSILLSDEGAIASPKYPKQNW